MSAALFLAPKTDRTSLLSAEDRASIVVDPDTGRARLVVADGAGTAHLSGLLAELIVESFLDAAPFGPGDNAAYQDWVEFRGEGELFLGVYCCCVQEVGDA